VDGRLQHAAVPGRPAQHPADLYEAAALDGARGFTLFRSITWPALRPVATTALILQLIASLKVFGQTYILTSGGPFNTTRVTLHYMYETAFTQSDAGYAAAIAMAFVAIVIAAVAAAGLAGALAGTEGCMKRARSAGPCSAPPRAAGGAVGGAAAVGAVDGAAAENWKPCPREFHWLPQTWTLDAFARTLAAGNLVRWLFNSFLVALLVTVMTMAISLMAAYAFSQLRFRGRAICSGIAMLAFLLPFEALLVPLFRTMNQLGLINSYAGIVLPQVVSPVAIYVFKQFFDEIPADFREPP
jgi:ABC-type glycerol-3-phosphate transport system permease component